VLPLGHTGITAWIGRRLDGDADLRAVALAAILPDLIDKPIALLCPGFANGWTRLVAHSLPALALFSATVLLLSGRRGLLLALAYALHLLADLNFDEPQTAFWPFLGVVPTRNPIPWLDRYTLKLGTAYLVAGEIVGLTCWLALWRERRRATRLPGDRGRGAEGQRA
jgi:hypothetical protein